MSIFKVVLVGTPGAGKKTLAHALLRHMGEDGGVDEDESGALAAPKQAALINNQKCLLVCDDVVVDDDEDLESESNPLLPKESGRGAGGKRPMLKKSGGGPKLRKKENIFDKAKMQKGLAKAKIVVKQADAPSSTDQYPTGHIIVFDIGDTQSFREAERQLDQLSAPGAGGSQKYVVLAGNKTDKSRRYRRITYEEGLKLSQKYPDVPYFETSAKLYQKVDKVFVTIVKKVQTSIIVAEPSAEAGGSGGGGGPAKSNKTVGDDESGGNVDDSNAAISGSQEDLVEGNFCYDNFCCKCCPKPFRKCGKKCGNKCSIM